MNAFVAKLGGKTSWIMAHTWFDARELARRALGDGVDVRAADSVPPGQKFLRAGPGGREL